MCCSPWGCKELDTTEQLNQLINFYLYLIVFSVFLKIVYVFF